jgi:hypothetical protein
MTRRSMHIIEAVVTGTMLPVLISCGSGSDGTVSNAAGNSGMTTTGGSTSGGAETTGGTSGDSTSSSIAGQSQIGGASAGGAGAGGAVPTGGAGNAGGGSGTSGAIATLAQPCTSPGKLACAGVLQTTALVCGASGIWEINQICANGTVCDARPGATAGTCQTPDTDCVAAGPGVSFCHNYATWICDVAGMAATKTRDCPIGACINGACIEATGCPSLTNLISCTEDCTGLTGNLCVPGNYTEVAADAIPVRIDTTKVTQVVVHLSYAAGGDFTTGIPTCTAFSDRRVYVMATTGLANARAQSSAPWNVVTTKDTNFPCISVAPQQCTTRFGRSAGNIFVYTDEPNSPDANILVEYSDNSVPACP